MLGTQCCLPLPGSAALRALAWPKHMSWACRWSFMAAPWALLFCRNIRPPDHHGCTAGMGGSDSGGEVGSRQQPGSNASGPGMPRGFPG